MLRKLIVRYLDLPLRTKLILSFLAVISFGGVVSLILGTRLEHRTIFDLAQAKVRHDLASAWMVYNEKISDIRDIVRFSASRELVQRAMLMRSAPELQRALGRIREDFGLDVLTATDAEGRVLLRTRRPEVAGDDQSRDPLVQRALRRNIIMGTEIVSREELLKEGEDLAARALLSIIPTAKSVPREGVREENGLMLKAAAPVMDRQGTLLGVLYGGILLNQNFEIVDRVKDTVFKGERYKGKEIGTVTIFQNDLRISTNVTDPRGRRAVGTLVSREVHRAVLQEGKPWVDRAFVVNHWYITAYEPIRNTGGAIVGMLYVGMLEKPYKDIRNSVMLTFTGLAILCTIILLAILYIITTNIIKPLRGMVVATQRIAQGDLNQKVERDSQDELGRLARSFNVMTENLKKANEGLVRWGTELEKRVQERTRELQEVQGLMFQSDKLASLGKMAAGVAHEINNPLTSILINTHLMLEKINAANPFYDNLSLIADETSRCTQIVKGLLEFSRQNPPQKSPTDINAVLERTIQLLENQAAFQNIRIVRDLAPGLPLIPLDKNKIQQVFWNLMLNAAEAMTRGGTMTIATRRSADGAFLEAAFTDTGVGIPRELLTRLFDPFFTTKASGTGLGLAVSYGIVQQHGGQIDVKSEAGQGSVFTVRLPVQDQFPRS